MNPDLHWQNNRSAKELAKSVFDNGTLVPKLTSVLQRFNFPVPEEMYGSPEKATKLPWGTRGDRKHDLLLKDAHSTIIVGVEAKADEAFDKAVKYKRQLAKKSNEDKGKNMSARLDGIMNFLYNNNPPNNKEDLMYQLLSATAGVILEASENNIKQACVVFLVFNSEILSKTKKSNNEKAWSMFCKSLNIDSKGGVINVNGVECLIVKEQIELIEK